MLIFIYLFMIMGIGLIAWGISAQATEMGVRVNFPQERRELRRRKIHALLSGVFPFSRILLEKLRLDGKMRNRLDAAHVNFSPQELFNLKLLLMVLLVILLYFSSGKLDPQLILLVIVSGYILPDLWLKKKISQRKRIIVRVLPETVDLLGLCVEAGLDFTTAVKWIIEKTPGNPMIEELALVLEQIKWGKPRTQALKDMSKRLNIIEVTSLVQTLVQAERMGTPVAQTFAMLSEDTRLQRFQRGERIAMKAPIKMLIPLIFCILPVIAIVIAGPILLQFMQGGLFKGF